MTMIVMVVFGRGCEGAVDGDVDFNGDGANKDAAVCSG